MGMSVRWGEQGRRDNRPWGGLPRSEHASELPRTPRMPEVGQIFAVILSKLNIL